MSTKTTTREKRAKRARLEYCQTASKVASLLSVLCAALAVIALTGLEHWDEGSPLLAIGLILISLIARAYESSKDHEVRSLEDELTRI